MAAQSQYKRDETNDSQQMIKRTIGVDAAGGHRSESRTQFADQREGVTGELAPECVPTEAHQLSGADLCCWLLFCSFVSPPEIWAPTTIFECYRNRHPVASSLVSLAHYHYHYQMRSIVKGKHSSSYLSRSLLQSESLPFDQSCESTPSKEHARTPM